MKKLLTIGICLLAFSTAASADKMYVNDRIRITVRAGPGIHFKVITEAESGQAMDVQEVKEGWSRVVLSDGKEGWVLARFLTDNQPKVVQLKALQKAHNELMAKVDALARENEQLREENQKLDLLSGESRRALEEVVHSYDVLKTESKDFLKVKSAYETVSQRFAEQKETADQLKARMEHLEWQENAVFFIGGGFLVLLGFLIGIMSRGGDRRKSSLI
jgi:SH3 domain protein